MATAQRPAPYHPTRPAEIPGGAESTAAPTAGEVGFLQPVPRGLHVMLRLLFGVRDLREDLHTNMQTASHT